MIRNKTVTFWPSWFLGVLVVGCSSNYSEIKHVPADPTFGGTVQIDILESGHPDAYTLAELIPSQGSLSILVRRSEQKNSPGLLSQQVLSFETGALTTCARNPSARSADERYIAACDSSNYRAHLSILSEGSHSVVWARNFDEGWQAEGYGWDAHSPSLAVLVKSSAPSHSIFSSVSRLLGHPAPDEAQYVIILVSAVNKSERQY